VARPLRIDAPGVAHHVWTRAVEGRPIFAEQRSGERLVGRLEALCEALRARCYAWAVMSNHFHLVVRTEDGRLSDLMHRLQTGVAGRFNRERDRHGHVFQSRFGSRIVGDDADLANVIRYVHRNPLEAGLVRDLPDLARYPWCGHAAVVGRRSAYGFEAVDDVLALFSSDRRAALREYVAFVARSAEREGTSPDPLAALIHEVCRDLGVSEAQLLDRTRVAQVSAARTRICQRAVCDLGLRSHEVAKRLRISEGAVSQALRRVSKVLGQTPF